MASAKTLIGLGMPAELAKRVGNNPSAKTGVGTAIGTATALTDNFTVLTTSSGQTAFILPVAQAGSGPIWVFCNTSDTALIFPQTGETIDNGSTSASVNVAQNKTAMFWKTSATNWARMLTA
jgi:hypothetical protein